MGRRLLSGTGVDAGSGPCMLGLAASRFRTLSRHAAAICTSRSSVVTSTNTCRALSRCATSVAIRAYRTRWRRWLEPALLRPAAFREAPFPRPISQTVLSIVPPAQEVLEAMRLATRRRVARRRGEAKAESSRRMATAQRMCAEDKRHQRIRSASPTAGSVPRGRPAEDPVSHARSGQAHVSTPDHKSDTSPRHG